MTLGVHYESPSDNPFKVPRPHWHDVDSNVTRGGEIGECTLLGFVLGLKFFDVSTVEEAVLSPEDVAGWFGVFARSGDVFTYGVPVSFVENVSP